MRFPRSDVSGVPNFARSSPKITAVKAALGYGLPRSKNVGCDRELAPYLADATTPQTVAVFADVLCRILRPQRRRGCRRRPKTEYRRCLKQRPKFIDIDRDYWLIQLVNGPTLLQLV